MLESDYKRTSFGPANKPKTGRGLRLNVTFSWTRAAWVTLREERMKAVGFTSYMWGGDGWTSSKLCLFWVKPPQQFLSRLSPKPWIIVRCRQRADLFPRVYVFKGSLCTICVTELNCRGQLDIFEVFDYSN